MKKKKKKRTKRLAHKYIQCLPDVYKQSSHPLRVILWGRISSRESSARRARLEDIFRNLRCEFLDYDVEIIDSYGVIESGWKEDMNLFWEIAAEMAKKNNAIIVTESTDRFIRSKKYNSKTNNNALPRKKDLKRLKKATKEVTLATILHPDASPSEVRSYQRKRGQKMKGNKGGRPKKNREEYKTGKRNYTNLSKVFWMKLTCPL
jgi:hypothetical protein